RAGMIESPKAIKAEGNKFDQHPVGVGPFEFVSRPSKDQITLKKSPDFYDKSAVKLDKIKFQVITQPQVRATDLQAGSVDVADRIQPSNYSSLKNVSSVHLDPVTTLGYQGITINVSNSNGAGKPPFTTVNNPLAQHPQLREAFKLTLNRKAINKVVFNGLYVPGCTPISPASPWFGHLPCSQPDIARAKKLVAQSGVKTPIPVTLTVEASNSLDIKLASVIRSMAHQAGFAVKVQPTEFTTALKQSQHGQFYAFQVGWSGRLDPDQNTSPFWTPKSHLNYSGADYASLNQTLSQAKAATGTAARKQLYRKAIQEMQKKNNIIYLYHPKFILGYRSNVTGIHYYADGLMRFKTAGFTSGS
ncbi:MAG TPA: ABC transporter substrate-binding protein, partial [Acidimicrobiales bacterium]|nr:ABC transporter substrate-binding protein [Acidimicrobiales bacterium]